MRVPTNTHTDVKPKSLTSERSLTLEIETIDQLTTTRLRVKIAKQQFSSFEEDVLTGLSSPQKFLLAKYFYDEQGSRLFEEITQLPEYYLTRTEHAILQQYADEIIGFTDHHPALLELGSGSSAKTRLLIRAFLHRFGELRYIPVDISKDMLVESAKRLLDRYPRLKITALASDYLTALKSLKDKSSHKKLIIFLGSSIGNFGPEDREDFLLRVRATLNPEDRLLIGMDLLKERALLEPAYDDPQGVTAEFNLNLLRRLNRELNADFRLATFRHRAFFNAEAKCIEMHLESLVSQTVEVANLNRSFSFVKGETIHTECSYKFSLEDIEEMAEQSCFEVARAWYDSRNWFSLNLLRPV